MFFFNSIIIAHCVKHSPGKLIMYFLCYVEVLSCQAWPLGPAWLTDNSVLRGAGRWSQQDSFQFGGTTCPIQ